MAFDDNPDEVFDNEPEPDVEGNGDEQSNRTFRYAMIGMFALGGLGVLLIALILIGRQGERQAIDAQNQSVIATNTAIAALALTPPTPLPTPTSAPTNTATPTGTPAPTATPAPKDLVDTVLSAGNFKTFSALLKTAGLTDTLKGQGPFTIFAPTDDAFAQLSPETLDTLNKDPEKLATLLKYHVIDGSVKAADISKLSQAKTLEGNPITITLKDDKPLVNDATITRSDLQTANGVIQTIDRVLVPPELRKEVVVMVQPTPKPGTPQQGTPASGKGTAIAQVQGTAAANATKPAGAKTTSVPGSTNVTLSPKEATAAAAKGVTNTQTISGTTGTGSTGLPTTGAGDNLVIWLVAAVGLVGVLIVARRLRTAQS